MSTQPSPIASDDTQTHIVGAASLDFTMVVTSIMRDPNLSHAARTLYTILVSYASINGGQRGVWPSVATLAEHMGCSASSTRRYLHELVNAKIITVTERRNEDGGQTSNLITLHDKARLMAAHPPFHPRQEAPTTGDKAPLPPVTPKQEPLEQEPLNKKERTRPTSRLRPDWQPTAAHKEYALANRLDLTFEAMKFRNHAEANDRRQVSWDAAFSNWLLSSKKRAPQPERSHWEKAAARPLPTPAPAVSAEQVRAEQEEYQRRLDREAKELAEYQASARRARKEAGL